MAVLVAPGNGGNRASRAEFAKELSRRGLAVLLAGADHNDPVMFGARVAAAVARLANRVD